MPDDDILRWAVSEQRIIVTTDHDFEEMIWRAGKAHCGVLRLENLPRAERGILLDDVLHHHRQDLASGAIVIAQSRKIRIRRPFPWPSGH
jgi:predicted nuclease of predicted toxin-antitoxin system